MSPGIESGEKTKSNRNIKLEISLAPVRITNKKNKLEKTLQQAKVHYYSFINLGATSTEEKEKSPVLKLAF